MSGLWAQPTADPPPGVDDPTRELPVFGPVWAPPDTRDVNPETAINRIDYHIDRIEAAADEWRHAAYATYQAATRCRLRMRHANTARAAGMFAGAAGAGVTGWWLWTIAGVAAGVWATSMFAVIRLFEVWL